MDPSHTEKRDCMAKPGTAITMDELFAGWKAGHVRNGVDALAYLSGEKTLPTTEQPLEPVTRQELAAISYGVDQWGATHRDQKRVCKQLEDEFNEVAILETVIEGKEATLTEVRIRLANMHTRVVKLRKAIREISAYVSSGSKISDVAHAALTDDNQHSLDRTPIADLDALEQAIQQVCDTSTVRAIIDAKARVKVGAQTPFPYQTTDGSPYAVRGVHKIMWGCQETTNARHEAESRWL